MENEETQTEDIETSENNEVVEETQIEDTDTDSPSLEDYQELQKKNKELYERAKKAEALAKEAKQAKLTKSKPIEKSNLPEEDLIRTAKLAQQLDEEDLDLLRTIQGDSLAEKLENPLFKAYKEAQAKKLKSEGASLPPSSSPKVFSEVQKPGMDMEEHKKLWQKVMNN